MKRTKKIYGLMLTLVMILVVAVCGSILTACGHEHTFEDAWSSDATNHWHKATCEHAEEVNGKAEHTIGEDGKCSVCGYYKTLTEAEIFAKLPTAMENLKALTSGKVVDKSKDDRAAGTEFNEKVYTFDANGLGVENYKNVSVDKVADSENVHESFSFVSKVENDFILTGIFKHDEELQISRKMKVGDKKIRNEFLDNAGDSFMGSSALKSSESLKDYVFLMATAYLEDNTITRDDVVFDTKVTDDNGTFTIYCKVTLGADWLANSETIKNASFVIKLVFNRDIMTAYTEDAVMTKIVDNKEETEQRLDEITFSREFDSALYDATKAKAEGLEFEGSVENDSVPFNIYVNGVLYNDYTRTYAESANGDINGYITQILNGNVFGPTDCFEMKVYLDSACTKEYDPDTAVPYDLNDGVSIYLKITGKDNFIPVVATQKFSILGIEQDMGSYLFMPTKANNFDIMVDLLGGSIPQEAIEKIVVNGEVLTGTVVDLTACGDSVHIELYFDYEFLMSSMGGK